MKSHWRFAWYVAWTPALSYVGCHTDSGPQSSSSTHWAECDSFDDCAGVANAAACDSTGYCVDADGHRIGEPSANNSPPNANDSSSGPVSVACSERTLETCANDAACYVRQARPIDVDRRCLLAPQPATCAPTNAPCANGPVQCVLDASGVPWFSVECGGLQQAPAGHPCGDVVGSHDFLGGAGGAGGTDGGSSGVADDCPEAVEDVATNCSETAAAAHALVDEALAIARYDCSSDADCAGRMEHLECF